jgi:1-acyl-sn-glycerol-3-phosphate acyltransferase
MEKNGRRLKNPVKGITYRLARAIASGFCKAFWRVKIIGAEKMPEHGPYIIAPVHRSNIDFILTSVLTRNQMRYMAKDSLFKNKHFASFLTKLGAFAVKRGTPDRGALNQSIEVLREGDILVLFPEGTRSSGDVVDSIHEGAAYVALKAGCPIVPIGIANSDRAMPKGSKIIKPVKIILTVGDPIKVDAKFRNKLIPRSALMELTEEIKEALNKVYSEARNYTL